MISSSPSCPDTFGFAEQQRLGALEGLALLDTPESESFDRITRLASTFFEAPIAAMSLTDRTRQWFKSSCGVEHREIPREGAPCAEVTRTRKILYIPNMLEDDQFKECLLAQSGVRFYAGAPLTTRQGHTLGAFCVLDNKPRELSAEQLGQLEDMAALVMAQVELQHEFGRIDPVSGLPNRHQLEDDLQDLRRKQPEAARVLLLIEIADLRHINEAISVLGVTYLEDLAQACAARIRSCLRKGTVLYHVGSTMFAAVLNDDCEPWHNLIDDISEAVGIPLEIRGSTVTAAVAYGVAPFEVHTTVLSDALRMATSAVHEARQSDFRFAVYSESSHAAHRRRFSILRCFQESLRDGNHFVLVYQPRLDLASGRCIGTEALLRWSHPELGSVSPGEFIPLIEQTSLAGPMTQWVLDAAFAQVRAWKSSGHDLCTSINVSARNLEESRFAEQVASAMSLHGIAPSDFELEFTESAVIRHEGRVLGQLSRLRELGVSLAIDDFGTGYSSFSYLRKLPAQVVKLDQSFIRNIGQDAKGPLLVGAMIRMSHELGYRVVAEGIETGKDLALLQSLGCDEAQGYFIARPLAVNAFEEFLEGKTQDCRSAVSIM